jgi:hypothetical protein
MKDPKSIKPCAEIVDYHPLDCQHSKPIKCYLKKEYTDGKKKYTCPEKLVIELPRCGHEAKVNRCGVNLLSLENDVVVHAFIFLF